MGQAFDSRAWIIWVIVASITVLSARNPLYVIVILLSVMLVNQRHGTQRAANAGEIRFVPFVFAILFFSTLFNLISVHFGDTVLFSLPSSWPLIGGPFTLEAAVFGFSNGLVLLTLLLIFITFNRIVPVDDLVRLTPNALHDLGIVLLIALTYVPQTFRHYQQIRDAQAIRGYRPSGWSDWRPIILPLLIGGLERAMNLAETMVSRGYGATRSKGLSTGYQLGLVAGLAAGLGGWVASLWVGWPGRFLMIAGVVLVVAIYWREGRRVTRTVYRPKPWTLGDSLLLGAGLAPLMLFFFADRADLAYNVYPKLTWPPFDPLVGLWLMLLAFPALLPRWRDDSNS